MVVSNRLPVNITVSGDRIAVHRSIGGVATALCAVAEHYHAQWVGWTGREGILPAAALADALPKGLIPIQAGSKLLKGYYNNFANSMLWPVLHSLRPTRQTTEADWRAYCEMNRRFAAAIKATVRPDELIWIHDYHLLMLPLYLRQSGILNRLGFFLHIPIPSKRHIRQIPHLPEILESLSKLDVFGVQTERDVRNFTDLLQTAAPGKKPKTTQAFPIGVDFQAFRQKIDEPEVQTYAAEYRERTAGKKIIFSLSRLDYTKGIITQLRAVERFLASYPGREQMVYKLVVAPSREQIGEYQRLKVEVGQTVQDINRRLGNSQWQPIDYTYENIDFAKVVAWYQLADVLLVLPDMDGMNLVAKEYVASRRDNTGVLVLSTGAGTAIQLQDALLVPPGNVSAAAAALKRAAAMPAAEQATRLKRLQTIVREQDILWWADQFVQALDS